MQLTAIQLLKWSENAYEGMGEKKGFVLHFIQNVYSSCLKGSKRREANWLDLPQINWKHGLKNINHNINGNKS